MQAGLGCKDISLKSDSLGIISLTHTVEGEN